MSKLVLVKNGQVINCIVPPEGDGSVQYLADLHSQYDDVLQVDDAEYVGSGFTYDGEKFTPPAAE